MSNKKTGRQLVAPGASGWEVWAAEADGELQRVAGEPCERPGDLKDLGAGETLLLFPVRDVVAMPFKAQTADPTLYADLAGLHIERLGVRVDPLGGQLTDQFLIEASAEQASLLAVALTPPADGFMPARPVGAFDFTARCLPLVDRKVTVWQELGRWVFALASHGKLLYCQATGASAGFPDAMVATEIRMAITQLMLQGFSGPVTGAVVWLEAGSDASGASDALEAALRLPVEAAVRPAPVWPSPPSHLLPADVRAEREARVQRQRKRAAIGAVAAVFVVVCAWLGVELWNDVKHLEHLEASALKIEPDAEAYRLHQEKWAELAPVIDPDNWPIEIVFRAISQIPRGGGLRLTQALVQSGEIRLVGEAPEATPTGQFDLALRRSSELVGYQWSNPPATQKSSGTWNFTFNGTPATTTSQP